MSEEKRHFDKIFGSPTEIIEADFDLTVQEARDAARKRPLPPPPPPNPPAERSTMVEPAGDPTEPLKVGDQVSVGDQIQTAEGQDFVVTGADADGVAKAEPAQEDPEGQ